MSTKDQVTPQAAMSITAANVKPSPQAKYADAFAFETITQGQPVAYLDPQPGSTPYVRLADATTYFKVIGLAAVGASKDQPIKVVIDDPALDIGGTIVAGDILYLGPAPGGLTTLPADITTGKIVQALGVGIGNNKVNLHPLLSNVPK